MDRNKRVKEKNKQMGWDSSKNEAIVHSHRFWANSIEENSYNLPNNKLVICQHTFTKYD